MMVSISKIPVLFATFAISIAGFCAADQDNKPLRLYVVPKYDHPFFDESKRGCEARATQLSGTTGRDIQCVYAAPSPKTIHDTRYEGQVQAEFIFDLLQSGEQIDAMAVSSLDATIVAPVLNKLVAAGIPVITFDSDAPNSDRTAYVGTDNIFMGRQLARLAKQYHPEGGTYLTSFSSEADNLIQRANGVDLELAEDPKWTPIDIHPIDTFIKGNADVLYGLHNLVDRPDPPTALFMCSWGYMNNLNWTDYVDGQREAGMTFWSVDASETQLEFLTQGYAHGLIGQTPYGFGVVSIDVMYALANGEELPSNKIPTEVIGHVVISPYVPDLLVDQHLLNNVSVTGFVLFGIVGMVVAVSVAGVDAQNVKMSKPFAHTIGLGTILLGAALIPLSFDDNGDPEDLSATYAKLICMSVPWLAFCGLAVLLAAFFAQAMHWAIANPEGNSTASQKVEFQEMLKPLLSLVGINVLVLSLWTALDPLEFSRTDRKELDLHGRVNKTYGECQSDHVLYYLIPLTVVNSWTLVYAMWMVHNARQHVPESVSWGLISLFEGATTGVPILFAVRDSPQKFYMFFSFTVFLICVAVIYSAFFVATTTDKSDEENMIRGGTVEMAAPAKSE